MASRTGDSTPKAQSTPLTESTKTEAATAPVVGCVYRGTIDARSDDGTYAVRIDDPRNTIQGVLLAAPVFGGLLGFNVQCRLNPGTEVELSYGTPSFIHAILPPKVKDWKNAKTRSTQWGDSIEDETKEDDHYSLIANDMLEGEAEISNMFGVAMNFLTTLIRMSAGDRASVECHLINDMVRIISAQYRHFSGMGDELIFDHGRPTMERNWSSYRHEVWGKLQDGDELAEMRGDEIDRDKLEGDRLIAVGRNRLIELVGFAGDFIHSFVADPPNQLIRMTGESVTPSQGKSWIHRNTDGTVLIQSLADIRLERVVRIPVPARKAIHEDPKVTKARQYNALESDFLKLPNFGSFGENNAFYSAYHLRSYSRWLSRYHAFARMHQLDSDYDIQKEGEGDDPTWTNNEVEKEQVAGQPYFEAYACITILRDGSIVMFDGYGSSITLSNGNVQVAASRHLDLQAAGDIRIVSGGSIHMKAKRNIELSAVGGGIILHSYAWMRMLCEKGSMWLRSNALTKAEALPPQPKFEDSPIPEVAGYVALPTADNPSQPTAVLIEAAQGNTVIRSERKLTLMVDGGPTKEDPSGADICLRTKGDISATGRDVGVVASQYFYVSAPGGVAMDTPTISTNSNSLYFGLDGGIFYRGGRIFIPSITTTSVATNSIRSFSTNVAKLKDRIEPPILTNERVIAAQETVEDLRINKPVIPWESSSKGPKWGFCAKSEYIWDVRDATPGSVAETLTQQYLRLDQKNDSEGKDQWGGSGYDTFNMHSTLTGPRTYSNVGFGYYEMAFKANEDLGNKMGEISSRDPKDYKDLEFKWEAMGSFLIRNLKRT